jgi:hypothetical protein
VGNLNLGPAGFISFFQIEDFPGKLFKKIGKLLKYSGDSLGGAENCECRAGN